MRSDDHKREANRASSKRWREKHPKLNWCSAARWHAKVRAAKKGVPFDLSMQYIYSILPDKCPVFGTPFIFSGNKVQISESPSVDRIDPSKGYVEGNIRIVSAKANQIKSAFTTKDVSAVADWMNKEGY
jgi:hypothetical protein